MKTVTLETATRYARYLKVKNVEEFRMRMEKALATSETMIEAAKKAAR